MSGPGFIKQEGPLICSDCGKWEELRPYGKDGAMVCFDCGMKDKENTKRQCDRFIFGAELPEDLSDGLGTHDRKE